MLNLDKAIKLYKILKPHVPKDTRNISSLEYIKKIIYSIEEENPKDYVDAIQIMYNISLDDLKTKDADEILDMFIEGLSQNKFLSLCDFIGSFGHGKRKSG